MNAFPSTVAVIGPGLLGGSVGLALQERAPDVELRLWARRESARQDADAAGLGEAFTTDLGKACAGAGLILFATPVGAMAALAEQLLDLGALETAIATDVGSVKQVVMNGVGQSLRQGGIAFVGSHPMAGSEQSGMAAANADLFCGATCVITPPEGLDAPQSNAEVEQLSAFWEKLGGNSVVMSAGAHDRIVAAISHLPHAAAAAIVRAALGGGRESDAALAGAGMRDTTRIAGGPASMWAEILLENRAAVTKSLQNLGQEIEELLALLDTGSEEGVQRYLQEACDLRDRGLK